MGGRCLDAGSVFKRVIETPLARKRGTATGEAEEVAVAAIAETLAGWAENLCVDLEGED